LSRSGFFFSNLLGLWVGYPSGRQGYEHVFN
jgi:hypothetical protein